MPRPPIPFRRSSAAAIAGAALLLSGCGGDSETQLVGIPDTSPTATEIRAHVSGSASQALNADGQFVLGPAPKMPLPTIDEGEARQRAVAWARTYAQYTIGMLERGHGAPIDVNSIQPCRRTFFVDTPYEPVPAGMPNHLRNAYGPWWLVTLCSTEGVPQVSLAVAAYATDVKVVDGRIVFPNVHGNEFFPLGIPLGQALTITPERAVEAAHEATGRRAAEVPQLVLDGSFQVPQHARWRFRLEAPAALKVKGTGKPMASQELYVTHHARERAPQLAVFDPAGRRHTERTYYIPPQRRDGKPQRIDLRVQARPGYALVPVQVEPAAEAR